MRLLLFCLCFVFSPLSFATNYCRIGADPVNITRQPNDGEQIVFTTEDREVVVESGSGHDATCVLRAGTPVVIDAVGVARWVYRCGNGIKTPFKVRRTRAVAGAEEMDKEPQIVSRTTHRMTRPCFECGTSAPAGSWEHDMNVVLKEVPAAIGYATAGYFIGQGSSGSTNTTTITNSNSGGGGGPYNPPSGGGGPYNPQN